MTLTSPWWLLLLALGALIVVLHMRRRPTVTVSSTFLWQRLGSDARARPSVRPPVASWLLLLQLLALALMVVALARPSWGEAGDVDHWIVVFDASGSMQATDVEPSRAAAAVSHVEQLLDAWGKASQGGRFSLVAVTSRAEPVGVRLSRHSEVKAALERLPASHGPADWPGAAALVAALLREGESARVTLLTDGVGHEPALAALASAVPDLDLEAVTFAGEANNVGLVGVEVTPLEGDEGRWRVGGEVRRYAGEAREVRLALLFTPDGTEGALEWTALELDASSGDAVAFEVEVSLPGAGVLELRLPDDDLAHDNHAFFVLYGEPRRMRVLHVGPDNRPLERAFEAIDHVELYRAEALPSASERYDLVIVDRTDVARHPGTHTLWLDAFPHASETPSLRDPDPSGWQTYHPLAASVDWSALALARARQVQRLPGAEVLLEASGLPLVQARTTEHGREVVVAFDVQASNWPEQLGFPAFIANLVRWVQPELGRRVAAPCEVGAACALEPRWLASSLRLLGPNEVELPLPTPYVGLAASGEGAAWLPSGVAAAFYPAKAGLYRLDMAGATQAIAVHALYPSESELGMGVVAPSPPAEVSWTFASLPLWAWVLLAALVVLLVEGWLAGRGVERFLYLSALAGRQPLATRRRLVLGLRIVALGFLALAILQLPAPYPVRESRAVFVIDDPHVYDEQTRAELQAFVAAAAREVGASARAGLIRIGDQGRIAADVAEHLPEPPAASDAPKAANLETALLLAAAMLPESGRIVLASDGSETRGEVGAALPQLIVRGVPIDVYPLRGMPAGEVMVEQALLPRRVHENEPFLLQGIVYSERRTPAVVRIWREGELWASQEVELMAGRNRVEVPLQEDEPGTYRYEIEVEAEGDVFGENNRYGVSAFIHSSPRVAIFTPQQAWGEAFAEALELQGLSVEIYPPNRAPFYLGHENPRITGWLDFDVVILMNVPALELQWMQQELMQTWVRDHGGGLVVLGGENTFGPGGYYQTVLEEVLPLSTEIPQEKPSVAISFVLDRSGSMRQAVGEVSRLDVAKQATLAAVELLDEESLVGVVVFDADAEVLVPMQRAGDHEALAAQLEPLQPGGGTAIYPGLVLGFEQISQVDEELTRHIVVMTDGLSQPGDFEGILSEITAAGITVSAVAIGQGADVRTVENIARWGGGAAHVTTDFRALPSILAQEALLLSDEPIQRETFTPIWGSRDAPFLAGVPAALPSLHGHVLTTAKPTADVHLYGPDESPLLASWRYGLGRVVAFASHGAGPWSADWLAMPEYPLLWAQVVRWAMPGVAGPGLHLEAVRDRDTVRLFVEAVRPDGEVGGGLELEARVQGPGGEHALVLRELEAGWYTGVFIVNEPGSYHVQVEALGGGEASLFETVERTVHVTYPARYAFSRQGGELLMALANSTGGRVLLGNERIFVDNAPWRWVTWPAWPLWTLLALGCLLAELVVRYAPHLMPNRKRPMVARWRPEGGERAAS